MQQTVEDADIFKWADTFMETLEELKHRKTTPAARYLDSVQAERVEVKYCYATRRLLLLDYDGTLVPFHNRPEAAIPDAQLIQLLQHLAEDNANRLVVVSGRDRHTLGNWMGEVPADLIAEHGAWHRAAGGEWQSRPGMSGEWKAEFLEVLGALPGAPRAP